MKDYRKREQEWLQKNPLRQWRIKNELYLKDIAAVVKVNFSTIFRWETGMAMPKEEQIRALSVFMKNDNLQKEFQKWFEKRPKLKKGE